MSRATREAYGQTLVELVNEGHDIVAVDADLAGSTKLADLQKAFPQRMVDVGIAEQNMVGVASGLALTGRTVFTGSFAVFATGRAYDQIRNTVCDSGLNVKICPTHAGITVGEDGASHQTFEDIALMREIPGMLVVNPADAVSAKKLLNEVVDIEGPAYVRLGRSGVPVIYDESSDIKIGKANVIREGSDVTIIATGIMVSDALEAAEELAGEGVYARVIDMHTIKPIDETAIINAARENGPIVTAEEHSVIGGLGSAVAEVVVKNKPVRVEMVGQKDTFGESGKPAELREKYGLTKADIVKAVKNVIA